MEMDGGARGADGCEIWPLIQQAGGRKGARHQQCRQLCVVDSSRKVLPSHFSWLLFLVLH
jgi:hypothetical protein